MKEQTELEKHYNKFNEDKRLTRRHGQVEYRTTMEYIRRYLQDRPEAKILDVGAGTGRYSIALAKMGFDVTAVELVKYNLGILRQKAQGCVQAYQGTALKLSRFQDNTFDVTLLLGPMYHLYSEQDRMRALQEARRVTRPGGVLFVAYLMNEYAVLVHGFRDGYLKESLERGLLDPDTFETQSGEEELYSYVRLEQIDRLSQAAGLHRDRILTPDGPANYMRQTLRMMDDETFELFMKYHLSVCERPELLGAAAHTLDILIK